MSMVNRLDRFRREEFQSFVSVLLSAANPDFQAVEGAGGDFGNDGFLRQGDTLFQAYAPDRLSWPKTAKKIVDSLELAYGLKQTDFEGLTTFIFLTPFDLQHETHLLLQQYATALGLVAESWGEKKLLALLARHPEVRAQFPELLLPDLAEQLRALTPPVATRAAQVAEEVHAGFAEMVEQVRRWRTGPHETFGEFDLPDLKATWERWRALHHKARLHLPPAADALIDEMYFHVSQMRANHQNWRMFREEGVAGAYPRELKEAFTAARQTHPELFMHAWTKLESLLRDVIAQ